MMVIQSECTKRERRDSRERRRSRSHDASRHGNHSRRHNSPSRRRSRSGSRRRSRTPPSKIASSIRKKINRSRSRSEERGQRYWGNDKNEDKDKDQYWNKYPKDERVGKRYYGGDVKNDKGDKQDTSTASKEDAPQAPKKKKMDLLTTRTGGAYIPPARLKMMQDEITDKSSVAYQRISWEALKKSVHGFINKVNTANIAIITREMFKENIIRARGLLCKSLMQAQAASPTFTHVYAALVSVINSKFPSIGELLLKRLIKQFKNSFRRNNKANCISSVTFIAHLVNQKVAHEIVGLEILSLLIESSTNDSIEVAIEFLKQSGQKLTEVSSKGLNAIFDLLRNILHEGHLEKRVQYMIEVMFQMRKDGFKDNPAIIEELELVEDEDQITHLLTLDEVMDSQDILNVFKADPEFEANEEKYKNLMKEILDSDSEDDGSGEESGSSSSEEEGEEDEEKAQMIVDNTETNLVALRRTIYLTIHSSLDYEECAHKLMKMQLKKNQEPELCHMFLDCCAEQRTYEKFYGLLAQRFCMLNKIYITLFEQIFRDTYSTTHRLDTNRLRNVGKFFSHLLFTDAICWDVLEVVKLNEDDTTSSSRIFIKILFQELVEYLGLGKLNERLKDPTLQEAFSGLFPRNNPRDTRFAINFFTSIGLGGLTDELREHLKIASKAPPVPQIAQVVESSSSSDSSSEESSSSTSSESDSESSSSSSSSDSSSDDSEKDKRKKKKNHKDSHKKKEKDKNTDKKESRSKENTKEDDTRRRNPSKERDQSRSGKDRSHAEKRPDRNRSERNYEDDRNRSENRSERVHEDERNKYYNISERTREDERNKSDKRSERTREGERNKSDNRSERTREGERNKSDNRSETTREDERNKSDNRSERTREDERNMSYNRSERTREDERNKSDSRSERTRDDERNKSDSRSERARDDERNKSDSRSRNDSSAHKSRANRRS